MAVANFSGDVRVSGQLEFSNTATPAAISAGSGAIDLVNKANGSLHLRSDALPEVKWLGSTEKIGFAQKSIECRLGTLVANTANVYRTFAPRKMKVTGISRYFTNRPASAAGTVVTGITGAGNALLQSASEDEEAATNGALTAYTLTGTANNLILAKGAEILVTITSDNADMTAGTNTNVQIYYEDN